MEKALQAIPPLLTALRQLLAIVNDSRENAGLTTEEIFEKAGVKIEANEITLLAELAKYEAL